MRIARSEIKNFRCLDSVNIEFDEVTTLIGPNGAGKSSILRALDWFFNGDQGDPLSAEDVYAGSPGEKISVRVDFEDLTDEDRTALGRKYAPDGATTFTAWRTWQNGEMKLTGKAFAFKPFEVIRQGANAGERKDLWNALRASDPDLELPAWPNDGNAKTWMDDWERDNPDRLEEAEVSDTEFFGFAGQAKLSGIFDFVLITADLRASEEASDNKQSVLGRILAKAIDREGAKAEIDTLITGVAEQHKEITDKHFGPQIETLSEDLTREVQAFVGGRSVEVISSPPEMKPQALKFEVQIDDNGLKTDVSRQGHGFQRSLLTAALKLLATHGSQEESANVIYLAIEEPELFQHPTQAKSFAASLRALAEEPNAGIQVGYATHSPYFIEPTNFDQIRRIERTPVAGSVSSVTVEHATMDGVVAVLDGFIPGHSVVRRLDNVCMNDLRDALFASRVLIVEGNTDQGVIEGLIAVDDDLSNLGIEVASTGSKSNLLLPAAVLTQLKIPFGVILDSDSGKADRMKANGKEDDAIKTEIAATEAANQSILKFFGHDEEPWPSGQYGQDLFAFDDRLEDHLETEWPEFETKRAEVVSEGRGVKGKNAATYRIVAIEAGSPPKSLTDIIPALV